jgi:branched-chain amino acid transport system substrate-binding protein
MKRTLGSLVVSLVAVAIAATACSPTSPPHPIRVGAIYPLSGPQSRGGGIDELRGVRLAASLVNAAGGVEGRPVQLVPIDVPGTDAVPAAVDQLHRRGVRLVMGSYGSTISRLAATLASRRGMLFWETGAVGEMASVGAGRLAFRVAPSGSVLGSSAIDFVARRVALLLHRDPRSLRFAVAKVNDEYGGGVGGGAIREIRRLGLPLAGAVTYDPDELDASKVVHRIAAMHPDVLFVSSYLKDGIALRREMVRQHLKLVASIGTSSSYCMPMFGRALGTDAVGLFASDKPDADFIGPKALRPGARRLLERAGTMYRRLHGQDMDAPALAGFAAAWALFHDVMPRAGGAAPDEVARAARTTSLPVGSLPNGSGLAFGRAGGPGAGANLRAASVIWEWTGVDRRAVVWPPAFATHPIQPIPLAA